MYDCLSIINRETGQGLIDLNRNGRIRIRRHDPRRGEGEIFVEWIPVLMLGRRRKSSFRHFKRRSIFRLTRMPYQPIKIRSV